MLQLFVSSPTLLLLLLQLHSVQQPLHAPPEDPGSFVLLPLLLLLQQQQQRMLVGAADSCPMR